MNEKGKSLSGHKGYSLIEVMVAMMIVGILVPPFFGMAIHFTKVNQKSRTILLADAAADNQYEELKSLSVPKLASMAEKERKKEGDFFLETEAKRYFPESDTEERGMDHLDLILKDNGEGGFLSYFVANDLQSLISLSGSGFLQVDLKQEASGMSMRMADADGNSIFHHLNPSTGIHELNICAQQMHTDLSVSVCAEDCTDPWNINVYESPFRYGRVLVHCNGQTFSTDQQACRLGTDPVRFFSYKAEESASALVSVQVKVFAKPGDKKPVSVRQGIIRAVY